MIKLGTQYFTIPGETLDPVYCHQWIKAWDEILVGYSHGGIRLRPPKLINLQLEKSRTTWLHWPLEMVLRAAGSTDLKKLETGFNQALRANFLKQILFIHFERERKGGRKKEREMFINVWENPGTWPATQACALTGNQTLNLSVYRPMLNPLNHTSKANFHL